MKYTKLRKTGINVSKMEHLEQAIEALEIELPMEETEYVEELYQPRNLIGHQGIQPMAGDKQD